MLTWPRRSAGPTPATPTSTSELLEELGTTTRALGRGTLILIDEMQDVPTAERATLNAAIHAVGQGADPLPVLLVGAGLPSLPGVLSAATSYAERLYEYTSLGQLDPADAHTALTKPALEMGVAWAGDALAVIDEFASGYPYFVQTGGKYAWDYAPASPISADDARVGLVAAQAEIDSGLYRARWQRATPQQRTLMATLAQLGGDGPTLMSDIGTRMGKERAKLSVARDQLIKKGLIYAPNADTSPSPSPAWPPTSCANPPDQKRSHKTTRPRGAAGGSAGRQRRPASGQARLLDPGCGEAVPEPRPRRWSCSNSASRHRCFGAGESGPSDFGGSGGMALPGSDCDEGVPPCRWFVMKVHGVDRGNRPPSLQTRNRGCTFVTIASQNPDTDLLRPGGSGNVQCG